MSAAHCFICLNQFSGKKLLDCIPHCPARTHVNFDSEALEHGYCPRPHSAADDCISTCSLYQFWRPPNSAEVLARVPHNLNFSCFRIVNREAFCLAEMLANVIIQTSSVTRYTDFHENRKTERFLGFSKNFSFHCVMLIKA